MISPSNRKKSCRLYRASQDPETPVSIPLSFLNVWLADSPLHGYEGMCFNLREMPENLLQRRKIMLLIARDACVLVIIQV